MKKSIPLAFVSFALLAVLAGCAVIATPIPPTFTAIPPTSTPEPTLTPTPSPTITAEPTSTPPADVLQFFIDMGATVMPEEEVQRFKNNIVNENGLQRISAMEDFVVYLPSDKSISFVYTKTDLVKALDKGGKIIVIADKTMGLDNEARGGSMILKALNSGVLIHWPGKIDSSLQTLLFFGNLSEWSDIKNNPLNNYNLTILDCSTSQVKPIGIWLGGTGTFEEMTKYLKNKGYNISKLIFIATVTNPDFARKTTKLPIITEDW